MAKIQINRLNVSTNSNTLMKKPVFANDFLVAASAQLVPFQGVAIVSGSISNLTTGVTSEHPGIARLVSSASANSGYYVGSNDVQILLSGGEIFQFVFNVSTLTNTTIRMGLHDTVSSADATDGVYFEIQSSGNIVGKTSSNSSRSTTTTNGTVSTSTWYTAIGELNSTATTATFTLLDSSLNVVWTDSLGTNIPTASGRDTGFGITATNSVGGSATLVLVDYMGLTLPDMVR